MNLQTKIFLGLATLIATTTALGVTINTSAQSQKLIAQTIIAQTGDPNCDAAMQAGYNDAKSGNGYDPSPYGDYAGCYARGYDIGMSE